MTPVTSQNTYLALLCEESPSVEKNFELFELKRHATANLPQGIYFPITCVISLETLLADGSTVMCRLAGIDGVLTFVKRNAERLPITVLKTGIVAGLRSDGLERAIAETPGRVRHMLDLYDARNALYALNGCCIAKHSLSKRLSRLLLRARLSYGVGKNIELTQEEIARLLATRRETITEFLNRFARDGILELHRGVIRIRKKEILQSLSCDCFTEEMKLEQDVTKSLAAVFRGFDYRTLAKI